jgi:hypothetical protein
MKLAFIEIAHMTKIVCQEMRVRFCKQSWCFGWCVQPSFQEHGVIYKNVDFFPYLHEYLY